MAQVFVRFGKGGAPGGYGGIAQVFSKSAESEELSSSGTSAATTITASSGDVARVTNNGTGTIWVTFGNSPTAAVETTHPIGPGLTEDFGPLSEGDKAAVIDDS